MLYIPNICDYLKMLTDEEVHHFAAINFSECFKSIRKEENLWEVVKFLCIFLTTPAEVEKYNQISNQII